MKIKYTALSVVMALAGAANMAVAANQVDIDAGKLALAKSHSKDAKDFAQLMITDHSGVNKSAVDLVTKLHVTPESDPTSQSLQKGGDDNLDALKRLNGSAFDRAYVDHEVAQHQAVMDAVDTTLIPSAQNAELKALWLERKVDELPENFRAVFMLGSVEELSVDETAGTLGIPEETVRSRHFRAKTMLQTLRGNLVATMADGSAGKTRRSSLRG